MKAKAQHTPGPWKAVQRGWDAQNGEWQLMAGERQFGKFKGFAVDGVTTDDEDFANARLVATAPELLDALTDLVGGCGKEGDLHSSTAMNKARAAIAKATGEGE